jgi:Tol biopolymer transport system component
VWSPDGRTIAFNSARSGHLDLYRKLANGSGAEELLYADGLEKYPNGWSRDGKFLLYFTLGGQQAADLFVLPTTADRPGAPLKPRAIRPNQRQRIERPFSPDGQWVAYQWDESRRFEIYVAPFGRPSEKHQSLPTAV